jgi:chromosome partitioning protein
MTKVIAVVNQKGGVAKRTSTVHLGAAIAEMGKKVLLVDLDSQGHIAEAFNVVADEIEYDMSDVFEGKKRIVDIIMPDVRTNLDVAPSNVRFADVETNGKLAS